MVEQDKASTIVGPPGSQRSHQDGLAEDLALLARNLHTPVDLEAVLEEVVRTSLRLIPAAVHASISLVEAAHTVESRAASGDLPRLIDALQSETGQGPCLDAAFEERIVRVPDLSDEPRWPRFAARAWEAGARSMLCAQLFVAGRDLGALNLYGRDTGDFGEECEEVTLLVATHAAIALAEAHDLRRLRSSLVNRDTIGQAKGILMERYKFSAHHAFLLLSEAASAGDTILIHVAEELSRTGTMTTVRPGWDPPPVHL